MSKILKQSTWEKAKLITSTFEGWLSGNFDNMGISYGFLQWNAGQNTLQPLFSRLYNEYPDLANSIFPDSSLLEALNNQNVREWSFNIQVNNRIVDPWYTALKNLYWTPEWQKIMDDAAEYYINRAIKMCEDFQLITERAFCLAFDICVQNGGLPYYEMIETEYIDKLKSWAETATFRSNKRWQEDVRKRKYAFIYGCDQGRGWTDINLTDQSMYEEENIEKKEEDDYMTREQIRAELLIPDSGWAKEQINKSLENGIISQAHDCNEIVTMGVLTTMMNNMLEEIKKTIQENK